MAVPSDPTVDSIIVEGMREGGQHTVTSGNAAHAAFKAAQFQTIKTELWAACKTDKLLEVETCLIASAFTSAITLPTDFDSIVRVLVFDADDTFRGTAQAGGTATITLASSFSATATDIEGRYIFITGGTGSGQFAQVLTYNDTTKVATVTANWTTPPDSTSTYLLGMYHQELTRHDYRRPIASNARPRWYSQVGYTFKVFPAGDKVYPLLVTYRSNLTRLDETGTTLVKHLRERRWLWIAGIKYKTAERYDDDRAAKWQAAWEQALLRYQAENVVYEIGEPHR